MPLQVTTSGVRTTYLYLVSFIAIIVVLIGTIMLVNLFITKVVFGLDSLNSWYEDPEEQCMHFLEEGYYDHGTPYPIKEPYPPFPVGPGVQEIALPVAPPIIEELNEIEAELSKDLALDPLPPEASDIVDPTAIMLAPPMPPMPTDTSNQERYDRCVKQVTTRIDHQNRMQMASRASTGLSMLIVALPLFLIHWGMINRRKEKVMKK